VKRLFPRHAVIGLDTALFIYHFEDHPRYRTLTSAILRQVSNGYCRAVVSELTLLELLVQPLRLERQDVADEYELLLADFPHLDLVPMDRAIILRAAHLRARHGLRSPDALIAATALEQSASLLITNDRQWQKLTEVEVVCLDDLL
jgi:predicted nucleic acid-binding protein